MVRKNIYNFLIRSCCCRTRVSFYNFLSNRVFWIFSDSLQVKVNLFPSLMICTCIQRMHLAFWLNVLCTTVTSYF